MLRCLRLGLMPEGLGAADCELLPGPPEAGHMVHGWSGWLKTLNPKP